MIKPPDAVAAALAVFPVDPVCNPPDLPPAPTPLQREAEATVNRAIDSLRPSPKQLRQTELERATRELLALLEAYDAQLLTEMVMSVGENGGPRYRFLVTVVTR